MEGWIYFVLMAYAVWSATSIIDKIVISKGYIQNPLVYIVLNGFMNVFMLFLLPFAGLEALRPADFLIVMAYGIFFSAGIAFYYKAVEYEEISKIIVLNQLTPIFTLGISFLFLGESLTRSHLAGFLMWIMAGLIVSYKPSGKAFRLSRAVSLMIISTFLIAVALVASKHVFSVTSFWSAFLWLRLASFSAVFVLLLPSVRNDFVKTFKSAGNNAKKLLLFKMAIDFSAFILLGYAITKGPISLVTALSNAVWPVFVFIIALGFSIFLPGIIKEDISKKSLFAKSAAVILILIGVYLVNL
ncbi:DMT family transporter [Candidatus Woesearchaeota archaeon]|nr:DMT family transporter [Candidatus Woesearchaeota archaeon]